jgi:hypothetical protein
LALAVAAVGFTLDRAFNDTTGPPYDDPLAGQIGFFLVAASVAALVVLGIVALVRLARR